RTNATTHLASCAVTTATLLVPTMDGPVSSQFAPIQTPKPRWLLTASSRSSTTERVSRCMPLLSHATTFLWRPVLRAPVCSEDHRSVSALVSRKFALISATRALRPLQAFYIHARAV